MDVKGRSAAIEACENILREDFKYNEEHGIWRSINRIIEGLLGAPLNSLMSTWSCMPSWLNSLGR